MLFAIIGNGLAILYDANTHLVVGRVCVDVDVFVVIKKAERVFAAISKCILLNSVFMSSVQLRG